MRINRSLLGWGLFLIVLGAVPLAARQGLISAASVERAWTLWPLLLIFAGLGALLRRTPIEPLAGLAGAVTFGLIAGSLIAGGGFPVAGCGDEEGATAFERRSGSLGERAEAQVTQGCGELTVQTVPGPTWTIEGSDVDARGPSIDAATGSLEIEPGGGRSFFDSRAHWTVTLPTDPELDLELRVNAGAGRFDLDGARLGGVEIGVNAGEATIDLGGVATIRELQVTLNAVSSSQIVLPAISFSGRITANAAGGIRICPPVGVGLRLTASDSVVSSHNYEARGLVRDGDAWETAGFDQAATRIELETRANAGSFELEAEGTCGA